MLGTIRKKTKILKGSFKHKCGGPLTLTEEESERWLENGARYYNFNLGLSCDKCKFNCAITHICWVGFREKSLKLVLSMIKQLVQECKKTGEINDK